MNQAKRRAALRGEQRSRDVLRRSPDDLVGCPRRLLAEGEDKMTASKYFLGFLGGSMFSALLLAGCLGGVGGKGVGQGDAALNEACKTKQCGDDCTPEGAGALLTCNAEGECVGGPVE